MPNENVIKLAFKKSETRLAGNPYGKSVYEKQVKEHINLNETNVIEFPNNIEKIASSFTQGFFNELLDNIGYIKVKQNIKIKSKYKELEENMYRDLI